MKIARLLLLLSRMFQQGLLFKSIRVILSTVRFSFFFSIHGVDPCMPRFKRTLANVNGKSYSFMVVKIFGENRSTYTSHLFFRYLLVFAIVMLVVGIHSWRFEPISERVPIPCFDRSDILTKCDSKSVGRAATLALSNVTYFRERWSGRWRRKVR